MPIRRILIAAALLCTVAVAANSSAQKEPSTAPPRGSELITVDFKGGSVSDYIEALRRASGHANIVVLNDLKPIAMPAVKLTNVDVGSALQVLQWIPRQQPDAQVKVTVREEPSNHADKLPVFSVAAEIMPMTSAGTTRTAVITVSDLLQDEVKAEELLTAVETAVSMIEHGPPAQIRFHEATGLLIANGRGDQIDSIQQVVSQLRERGERKLHRQRAEREAQSPAAEILALQQDLTQSQTRNELIEAELRRQERLIESLEAQVRELEKHARTLRVERDALEQQLKQLRPQE